MPHKKNYIRYYDSQLDEMLIHDKVTRLALLGPSYVRTLLAKMHTKLVLTKPTSLCRSADVVKRWTKQILLGLFIGTVFCQLIFTMTCSRILPFSKGLLFASIICSGLFFNGTTPLVFELIMECVFPVGEGTSVGMGLVLGSAVLFVFDAVFLFPGSDVQWMNWVSVGGIAFCVPLLLVYKSQYQRFDLDTA